MQTPHLQVGHPGCGGPREGSSGKAVSDGFRAKCTSGLASAAVLAERGGPRPPGGLDPTVHSRCVRGSPTLASAPLSVGRAWANPPSDPVPQGLVIRRSELLTLTTTQMHLETAMPSESSRSGKRAEAFVRCLKEPVDLATESGSGAPGAGREAPRSVRCLDRGRVCVKTHRSACFQQSGSLGRLYLGRGVIFFRRQAGAERAGGLRVGGGPRPGLRGEGAQPEGARPSSRPR